MVVPCLVWEFTSICPPNSSTMERDTEKPRPVPLSGSLVVKKGSNIRSRISVGMPPPLSAMSIRTWVPAIPVRMRM
jgi:hypothetical protein